MVNQQIRARGIEAPAVLKAMRKVERHRFVPADVTHMAYDDHALPIGSGQTISQPYIVAYMTEAADITSRETRLRGISMTFALESLGLVLGPVLGGVFSEYGLAQSAFIAAGIAAACLVLTLFAFRETRDPTAAVHATLRS